MVKQHALPISFIPIAGNLARCLPIRAFWSKAFKRVPFHGKADAKAKAVFW